MKRRPERAPPWWSLTEKTNWTKSGSGPMSSTGGIKATFIWFTACWETEVGLFQHQQLCVSVLSEPV